MAGLLPVLLYDGECRLCHRFVNFIIDSDPKGKIQFAALQSSVGRRLAPDRPITSTVSSVLLVHNEKVFDRSAALIRVFWILGGAWRLLSILWIVPKPLRDVLYDAVARRRFKWFGKWDRCRLPDRATQGRFLDWSEISQSETPPAP